MNNILSNFPQNTQDQIQKQLDAANSFYEKSRRNDSIISEVYYTGDINEIDKWVRYSLLFSDLTGITTVASKSKLAILGIDTDQPVKIIDDNEIPGMKKRISILSGYAFETGEALDKLVSTYECYLPNSRLIVKPHLFEMREIVAFNDDNSVNALLNLPTDEYYNSLSAINTYDNKNIIPVSSYNEKVQSQFDITIPYLEGLNLKDFSTILNDESLLLSQFRSNLKKAIDIVKNDKASAKEFIQDVIRPNIDLMEIKFKRIRNIHKLKVAGTFGSILTLSLITYATGGFLSALAQLAGIGLGTTGLIKSEAEYQESVGNFKENPYYLLWKMKNSNKAFF